MAAPPTPVNPAPSPCWAQTDHSLKGRGEKSERVFIGAGSNLGDRGLVMRRALEALAGDPDLRIVAASSLYRTEPVGYNDQEEFYNGVAEMLTSLEPERLLPRLKSIEVALGRAPGGPRWGPRTIDLDLLLYGDRVVKAGDLVIPHPEMHLRRFVLAPLAEIAPETRHPLLGTTAAALLAGLENDKGVTLVGTWR